MGTQIYTVFFISTKTNVLKNTSNNNNNRVDYHSVDRGAHLLVLILLGLSYGLDIADVRDHLYVLSALSYYRQSRTHFSG